MLLLLFTLSRVTILLYLSFIFVNIKTMKLKNIKFGDFDTRSVGQFSLQQLRSIKKHVFYKKYLGLRKRTLPERLYLKYRRQV